MSQEGSKLTRNKRMLAIVVVLASFAAVVFTLWLYDTISKLNTQPEAPKQALVAQVVEETPEPVQAVEEAAPEAEVQQPAAAAPTETARVAAEAPAQPAVRFAAEMTEAGIAASDQPIVESLVFKDYDWSLHNCACARLVYGTSFNTVHRFRLLNHYTIANYTNWTNAAAQATQGAW